MTSQTDELKPCPHVFTSKGGTSHCTLASSEIDRHLAEIDRLKRQVEVLRDGLEYYKSPSDYVTPLTGGLGKLYFDCGNVAGGALAAADKIEKE